jgi:spermidine synthase
MNQIDLNKPAELPEQNRFFPLILLLFIGSGCAALVYEVVWFQMLTFIIGSSSISLGVLLGTYMGGMCIGSITLPRIISSKRHPLRVYAFLELGIGIIGISILYAVPYIDKFYIVHAGSGSSGLLMRGLVCAICLLPPTFMMGATLPAIARWVEATPKGISRLGFFYSSNIIGAVLGCLLAGFYLLRIYDVTIAAYTAAMINLAIAVTGMVLSLKTPTTFTLACRNEEQIIRNTEFHTQNSELKTQNAIYLAIALSGLSALGAEVVWTRLMSLILGGTVYTFSIILATFLTGLAIGSGIGSFISRQALTPRIVFGLFQLLLLITIAWSAHLIINSIPFWPIAPWITQKPWINLMYDLARCLYAILLPACLWGASFPLALSCVISQGQDTGKVTGSVYAANTIGAIIGSLGFSLIIIPLFGTQQAQRILIGIATVSSLIIIIPIFWQSKTQIILNYRVKRSFFRFAGIVFLTVAAFLSMMSVLSIIKTPWSLFAYGRLMAMMNHRVTPGIVKPEDILNNESPKTICIYAAEGMDSSVAVTRHTSGVQSFHSDGKVQASTDLRDMRLQRMLGHISALLNKKPQSVLVVGCGTGVTAGSFTLHPDVNRIIIVDIEQIVPRRVAPMFSSVNYDVVNDKRTELVFDDGRHYIHSTNEKFDIITSDPIDPWAKGCAALSTVEYYQMCKDHLNQDGIISIWVPLYGSNLDTVKSLISTFFKVFPNGIIFGNDTSGSCYDAVLLGMNGTAQINIDQLQQRLDQPDYALVRQSLADVNFNSVTELMAVYAGRAQDMQDWADGAQINYDKNLRLQYLAGLWLNSNVGAEILPEILVYYKFPDDLFIGSDESINRLKLQLRASGRK